MTRTLTYRDVLDLTCQTANYLLSVGVKPTDCVTIYMPMVPELPATMLACMRIGAVHSVVFGGFSAESLAQRIADGDSHVVVTCSNVMRGGKKVPLKQTVDEALDLLPAILRDQQGASSTSTSTPTATPPSSNMRVLVLDHPDPACASCPLNPNRDDVWSTVIPAQPTSCPVMWLDAEHPSFMLYTSGSTGKPKGVVHTTGGYMVNAALTFSHVFDVRPDDVYWCTADCGWITGHTYVTYGPLLTGATQVIFEGIPTYPDAGRCWEMVDRYQVTSFLLTRSTRSNYGE